MAKAKTFHKEVNDKRQQVAILVVFLFAGLMTYFILRTFAAVNSSAIEAEQAVVTEVGVTTEQQNTASNSEYVRFSDQGGTADGGTPGGSGSCNIPNDQPIPGASSIGSASSPSTGNWGTTSSVSNTNIWSANSNGAIGPPGNSHTIDGVYILIDGGADAIKTGDGTRMNNMYIGIHRQGGGHMDGIQSQGYKNWSIENTWFHFTDGATATSAVIIETMRGGGVGHFPATGLVLDCIKITGQSPWGHDIRFQAKGGQPMEAIITNVEWPNGKECPDGGNSKYSRVHIQTGGDWNPETITLTVDDTVPDCRIDDSAPTIIRI